jgi:hypothetical protein
MSSIHYRLILFGRTVAEVEIESDVEAEEEYEEEIAVSGGSVHNFERDQTPLDVNDRYAPWEDGFGFR